MSGGAWLQLCVRAVTSRSAAVDQVGRGVMGWAGRSSVPYTVISPAPATISVANFVSKHCNVACSQVVRLLSSNTFGNKNMSTVIYYVSSGPGGMTAIKGCLIDM